MQAPRTLDLPCPWVHYRVLPQRLVVDSLIERSARCICGAKPPKCSNRSATFPVSESTPEGVRTEPPSREGQAPGAAEPDARGVDESVYRTSAEASVRHDAKPQVATQARTSRQRASPEPSRSSERVLPRRRRGGVEATLLETHGKPRGSSRVPSGSGCALAPAEAGVRAHRHPLDASHRRATEVDRERKTRSGNSKTSPLEFGSFRRLNPGDRCAGLPHRHHPLSGFLTLSAV
jgi:hypothetical protein